LILGLDASSQDLQYSGRTIYAKPLPFDTNLDTLTEFFGTAGKVESVRMRRHMESKDFKGSVFVEFDTAETADQVFPHRR